MSKHDDDNHANQMNPNNDAYWQGRGYDERPDDWEGNPGLDLHRPDQLNPNNPSYWRDRGGDGQQGDSRK